METPSPLSLKYNFARMDLVVVFLVLCFSIEREGESLGGGGGVGYECHNYICVSGIFC